MGRRMKWEDRRESTNVESQDETVSTGAIAGALGFLAAGVDAVARSFGIQPEQDELRHQLDQAQQDVDIAINALREQGGPAEAIAGLREQAQVLVRLQRSLTDGAGRTSPDLKQAIAAAVTTTSTLVVQGRDLAAVSTVRSAALAGITAASRRQVEALSSDIYDRRIFDPYLKFASAEEEAEYRRREAETKRYIDAELAKGTPEGALNAAGGIQGQMLEAAANGADQSPEFKERWDEHIEITRRQREAVRAAGGSTEEYDKRIEESVRRFLRSKGKTDAEIDAIIAASGGDPLAAVEPYLEEEKDAPALKHTTPKTAVKDQEAVTEIDDAIASLRASGTRYDGGSCATPADVKHGLAADAGAARESGGRALG